ncbi:MAG: DnaB-like helicase C-terminal domain-containing protein [Thermomicrobiales bacterium]
MSFTRRSLLQSPNGAAAHTATAVAEPPPASADAVQAPEDWAAETSDGLVQTRSLVSVVRGLNVAGDAGAFNRMRPIETGFTALDLWIGGGIRQGELLLLGGAQGVGKTTLCLQVARNIAASGQANVLYACYEHPEEYVLNRLLVQETIDPTTPGRVQGLNLDELQALVVDGKRDHPDGHLYDGLATHPIGARAMTSFDHYASRFHLVADAARRSSIEALEALITAHRAESDEPLVLFVDYLQKVEATRQDAPNEAERVTEVVQSLKRIALYANVAIVAIVAAEKAGLTAPRLRFTHLRGSSALMYEADIAVIMNDKWQIIDRDHIVFNAHKAQEFREWIVCTIEKNRGGRNLVEVEFQKRFEYCCFNPEGGRVTERLYEERIQGERT